MIACFWTSVKSWKHRENLWHKWKTACPVQLKSIQLFCLSYLAMFSCYTAIKWLNVLSWWITDWVRLGSITRHLSASLRKLPSDSGNCRTSEMQQQTESRNICTLYTCYRYVCMFHAFLIALHCASVPVMANWVMQEGSYRVKRNLK